MSIIPLVKSASATFIERAFKKSAGAPDKTDDTLSMKLNINKTAVPNTADTIWFPDSEDPNKPTESAAAPCKRSPIYALITGPVSGSPKI